MPKYHCLPGAAQLPLPLAAGVVLPEGHARLGTRPKGEYKIPNLRDSAMVNSRNLASEDRSILHFPLLLLISFRMRLMASNSNTPRGRDPANGRLVWLDELPLRRAWLKGGPQVARIFQACLGRSG